MGLKIRTVTGAEFEVHGTVTSRVVEGELIYYCAGQSWPEEIVVEIF